ncbi:hypothetical protein B0H19DRAFT_1077905 [Mycena capillaripes]|nr:hypothetical protein B0H19DRAFT_1077905 [Mycena capillaripes]
MSTRKERCCAIGIHRAPAHLSKTEFDARMSALADALCAVPVVQKNFIKFDVINQTNILDGHGTAMDIGEPKPMVLFLAEYDVRVKAVTASLSLTRFYGNQTDEHIVENGTGIDVGERRRRGGGVGEDEDGDEDEDVDVDVDDGE